MRLPYILKNTTVIKQKNNALLFNNKSANELVKEYGSPLYIYIEDIFRKACQDMKNLVTYPHFKVSYAAKANNNIQLLKIAREEGLSVDAISPGEIYLEMLAGFDSEDIFFVPNNVGVEEFKVAHDKNIQISVDSLSQLELFGKNFPNSKVAVRINPGIGDGHHDKVVTAGEKTKFGVHLSQIDEIDIIKNKYNLTINGLNIHIGSNFLDPVNYIKAAELLLDKALSFPDLDFIDIGGGLGISYDSEETIDLKDLGQKLDKLFFAWTEKYGKMITFCIEPGRYISADSGIILTTVHAIKNNPTRKFIGTDAGFNVIMRPMVYDAYHEIINTNNVEGTTSPFDICGNICETGDVLATARNITDTVENDVLAILDAGAYCYSMASSYNARFKPAEVLLKTNGAIKLIRRRENFADILATQIL